jgi:hypothetical protein
MVATRARRCPRICRVKTPEPKVPFKPLLLAILVWFCVACAATGGGSADYAVLDFSRPPNNLYGSRLVVLDGKNVNAPITKFSFRVDPGVHEIVVAAAITDPMQVGRNPAGRGASDPGRTTIETQAGKRYRIAARVLDERGGWEPVVWKIEDL